MSDIKSHLTELLADALAAIGSSLPRAAIELTRTKQVAHGDFACNAALPVGEIPEAQSTPGGERYRRRVAAVTVGWKKPKSPARASSIFF